MPRIPKALIAVALVCATAPAHAHDFPSAPSDTAVVTLPPVEVVDTFDRTIRRRLSASQGLVLPRDIANRPVYRPGEMLEAVPGLIVSQHSGEGKANQYYLRGFNLDHGTDFATFVAGIPVNMPTHGHGQGYSDLSFLIPELVSGVVYRKGPYAAEDGDFGSAGTAQIALRNTLEAPVVTLGADAEGHRRIFAAGSRGWADADVLAAFELMHDDGPWVNPNDYRRAGGLLRYSRVTAGNGFPVTAMGHDGRWNATDQVPERALESGTLPLYGAVDPTDGGQSHRYSLSFEWQRVTPGAFTGLTVYGVEQDLDLFSNFTYYLDDTTRGDQFEQVDRRTFFGLGLRHDRQTRWFGAQTRALGGVDLRYDDISEVGLHKSQARVRHATTRSDAVRQTHLAPFAQIATRWSPWFKSTLGLRGDYMYADVTSNLAANSGNADAFLLSPKATVQFGPWAHTSFFANAGFGFHSNDARGATYRIDPVTGDPGQAVDFLVRTRGAEIGLATQPVRDYETALSLWRLDIDSELLFIGDAGTTEATRPSRRTGVEWTFHAHPTGSSSVDISAAYSRARFTDGDPAGDYIPGSPELIGSAGLAIERLGPFNASARLRWFGPRPLIEDNSVRSAVSQIVNVRTGVRPWPWAEVGLEVFNLFDTVASDIDYFYASRLPGEPEGGFDDVHTHPQAPRTVRLRLASHF